jgi:hypothetical protein
MFGSEKMPGKDAVAPGHLEGFFSFDTINGKDGQKVSEIDKGTEYKKHLAFVTERRRRPAHAPRRAGEGPGPERGADPDHAGGQARPRRLPLRAFYTGAPHLKNGGKPGDPQVLDANAESSYADRYFLLKRRVDEWFDTHAGDLGGKGSKVYGALRANYAIEAAGTEHMQMMGGVQERKGGPWQHENMRSALGSLPTVPQGGP